MLMLGIALLVPSAAAGQTTLDAASERGRYVFDAAGCQSCHTDEKAGIPPLAGGPALATGFGTFYAPNITPDPNYGIGAWREADFIKAMREGISPDGTPYYPSFPYTSFTKLTDQDLHDLWAYLRTIPPVSRVSTGHQLSFPFSVRWGLAAWQWLYFKPGQWQPDPALNDEQNRGAYLVLAVAHCGECHTPRTALGGLDHARWLAGARMPDDGRAAPNLTSGADGLADWSVNDFAFALEIGETPEGGAFEGEMAKVVRNSTSRLTKADRLAIARYLKAVPPLGPAP